MSEIASVLGQHYAFGHGRLSVLIQKLMTQSDIDRFLGASDFVTAKRMLADVNYIASSPADKSVDEVLTDALTDARKESEKMLPEAKRDTLKVLWLPFDMALLGFLIKEKKGLTSEVATKPQTTHTAYNVSDLEAAVAGNVPNTLPQQLIETISALMRKEHVQPMEIDNALAKLQATVQLAIAKKSRAPIVTKYVKHTIDLLNTRSFLRSATDKEFAPAFIEGGLLPLATFTGDNVSFIKALMDSPYGFAMGDVLPAVEKGQWVALEQAIAHVRVEDLKEMWNQTLGPGPVFAYIATIIEQTSLLRAILIGKQAEMSPQEIKAVVPPFLAATYYA